MRGATTEYQVFKPVPNYFAVDCLRCRVPIGRRIPQGILTDLKRFSTENALIPIWWRPDPAGVEFNPGAVSRANAVGLMQLRPKSQWSRKARKIRHFATAQLFTPEVNLRLGTRYLEMVDKFGSFEYALAAYNASSNRVDDWLGRANTAIRRICRIVPFTETREYVQAILRNANVYRQLYGTPWPSDTENSVERSFAASSRLHI
jgi:soluble lytic murein transglycosylase